MPARKFATPKVIYYVVRDSDTFEYTKLEDAIKAAKNEAESSDDKVFIFDSVVGTAIPSTGAEYTPAK